MPFAMKSNGEFLESSKNYLSLVNCLSHYVGFQSPTAAYIKGALVTQHIIPIKIPQ